LGTRVGLEESAVTLRVEEGLSMSVTPMVTGLIAVPAVAFRSGGAARIGAVFAAVAVVSTSWGRLEDVPSLVV